MLNNYLLVLFLALYIYLCEMNKFSWISDGNFYQQNQWNQVTAASNSSLAAEAPAAATPWILPGCQTSIWVFWTWLINIPMFILRDRITENTEIITIIIINIYQVRCISIYMYTINIQLIFNYTIYTINIAAITSF